MEAILVKPKNKEEFELVFSYLKEMKISSSIQKKETLIKAKTKKDFLDSLPKRLNEVKLHIEGKIKLKEARSLLNEI